MHFIQVGARRLNLEYLVMDEENDGTDETAHIPPGVVRVTMLRGKEFNLTGDDADVYRRHMEGVVVPDPATAAPSTITHVAVDPCTGSELPRRQSKKRG